MSRTRTGQVPPEPKRRGALDRDRDGDTWRRGTRLWSCTAPVDGRRVRAVARMSWDGLTLAYGPVQVLDLNDRPEVAG